MIVRNKKRFTIEYQKTVEADGFDGTIDKFLYGQYDTEFMNYINDFLLSAVLRNTPPQRAALP